MKEQELEIILENLWSGEIDINKAHQQILRLFSVSGQSEQLVNFLLHLNDKKLINNHDFDYEKEAKKYLKKIN